MAKIIADVTAVINEFVTSVGVGFSNMTAGEMIINILDILLMSALFFAAYKFISKRRAGQLAVGVLLILGMTFISSVLGMRGISSILSNFYQVGIIAIIIVFQPELRAALEKVGGNALVAGIKNIATESRDQAEINQATDELVNAVSELSRTKTGAIIVLENTTKLGEYVNTGKIIDAKISAELLNNIFFNKAPLHDGAVIVRDLRVLAASCFLPLTSQDRGLGHLGSRHRAAIGISENSDALVLIVSEETGTISIAYQGDFSRHYSRDKLHEVVLLFFMQQNVKAHLKSGKNKWRRKSKSRK